MVVIESSDFEVREISSEEAAEFLEKHYEKETVEVRTSIFSLGLFSAQKLSALGQFCYPPNVTVQQDFSLQLLHLAVSNQREKVLFTRELLTLYRSKYSVSDIFTTEDISPIAEELGFTYDGSLDSFHWTNPERTFYTYRITALDSDKYYYGVSHVKKANATIDDCLNDGYFGTGSSRNSNKFRNWKEKHREHLQKEIVDRFSSRSRAYLAEKELVSDLWEKDPLCLNTVSGGRDGGIGTSKAAGAIRFATCQVHGYTKFRRKTCCLCSSEKSHSTRECSIHGMTKFVGSHCFTCQTYAQIKLKNCPVHGETKFRGSVCIRCMSANQRFQGICEIHGRVKFQGAFCTKCIAVERIGVKLCPEHGETQFQGNSCLKCSSNKAFSTKTCKIHGEVTFQGNKCCACMNEARVSMRKCPTHGMTKHQGNSCCKCSYALLQTEEECAIHGLTLFQSGKCRKCFNNGSIHLLVCPTHGESKHHGGKCFLCVTDKANSMKECSTHGLTKHVGDTCRKCAAEKSTTEKGCPIHGKVKHRGSSCCKCIAAKTAHARFHLSNPKNDCFLCLG